MTEALCPVCRHLAISDFDGAFTSVKLFVTNDDAGGYVDGPIVEFRCPSRHVFYLREKDMHRAK